MKSYYPLKRAQPTDFVQPVAKYLQQVQSPQKAHSMRQCLAKITQLRNKVTALSYDQLSVQLCDKYIPAIEMYVRFALLMSKHLNWQKEFGTVVDDVKIVWYDSFNPNVKFMKNDINFDVFCCFYNLAVLYLYKAIHFSFEDLNSTRQESIKCAKTAYFLLNRMRNFYYSGFVNTGFSDTDYSHLEILENLAQGIFYKNVFNMFKQEEYKLGIDKIASVAGLAQKHFLHAYQVGNAYFMKSSYVPATIKTQVRSLTYVQSLYHDLMFNTRLAKFYEEEMDKSKDNIIYLIAYQRKALRLLNIGLNNQSVVPLLNNRPEEKKELMKIKPVLQQKLKTNQTRNKEIYKKAEIKQEQIPPAKQAPQSYIIKLDQPESLKISYQGAVAAPFQDLVDNQSKGLMNDLKQFSRNRMAGLESSYTKLGKNVQIIYNDNYVNFYANLENNSKKNGLPQALKQKINQIKMNGGKEKLDMQVKILTKNSEQTAQLINEFRQKLQNQQNADSAKRNQYGNQWRIQPSPAINRDYYNDLQVYQKKSEVAANANKTILEKYHNLGKYIAVVGQGEQQIMSVLPKVEITKFIEDNKAMFSSLSNGLQNVKNQKAGLDSIVEQIKRFYQKMDFLGIANKYYKKINENNREQILNEIFSSTYKLIEEFNARVKRIQDEAKKVGEISAQLNKLNKGDQRNKKDFEEVMAKFNDISGLFRELGQGTAFYAKLSEILLKISEKIQGFVSARQLEAQQLQQSIKRGGFGGQNNLPNMYPNQPPQQLGFYVPPPMVFSQMPNQNMNNMNMFNNTMNMGDLLNDMMRSKPNFNANVFGGQVYQSKFY